MRRILVVAVALLWPCVPALADDVEATLKQIEEARVHSPNGRFDKAMAILEPLAAATPLIPMPTMT